MSKSSVVIVCLICFMTLKLMKLSLYKIIYAIKFHLVAKSQRLYEKNCGGML